MHYHTFGVHDFILVLKGCGRLHLAQIENDKIVKDSQEIVNIIEGDFYELKPFILHGFETLDSALTGCKLRSSKS